jgi:hypothetical protein
VTGRVICVFHARFTFPPCRSPWKLPDIVGPLLLKRL